MREDLIPKGQWAQPSVPNPLPKVPGIRCPSGSGLVQTKLLCLASGAVRMAIKRNEGHHGYLGQCWEVHRRKMTVFKLSMGKAGPESHRSSVIAPESIYVS